jgi:hypothetical protein
MDTFPRLIRLTLWFFLGVLLSAWALLSHADDLGVWGGSASGGCTVMGVTLTPSPSGDTCYDMGRIDNFNDCSTANEPTCINVLSPKCLATPRAKTFTSSNYGNINNVPHGVCFFPSDYTPQPPCTVGTQSTGFYDMGTNPTSIPQHLGCDAGCSTNFQGTYPVGRSLVGGVYHYFGSGSWVRDGTSCSAGNSSPTSSPALPAPNCATGQVLGQVNGSNTCLSGGAPVDPNTTPTPDKKTESPPVTNPDGSSTQTTTQTNEDGSTTTITTITSPDGNKTTSKTTKNADATSKDPLNGFCATAPESPICKGQDAFCKSNPTSIVCKNSTFGGSCGAFSCDGDAVQCAIAKEEYKRNCTLYDTPTPLSDLGDGVSSGNDPQASSLSSLVAGSSMDVKSAFTAAQGSRWLGSGDLPNVSFNALGHTYSFDLSAYSAYLRVMGNILVAVALVVALRVVTSTNGA